MQEISIVPKNCKILIVGEEHNKPYAPKLINNIIDIIEIKRNYNIIYAIETPDDYTQSKVKFHFTNKCALQKKSFSEDGNAWLRARYQGTLEHDEQICKILNRNIPYVSIDMDSSQKEKLRYDRYISTDKYDEMREDVMTNNILKIIETSKDDTIIIVDTGMGHLLKIRNKQ